jgi:hypothetical protein
MSEERHCYTNLCGGIGKINNKLAIILRQSMFLLSCSVASRLWHLQIKMKGLQSQSNVLIIQPREAFIPALKFI